MFACVAVVAAGLLGFGYFLEYQRGLDPCPLCLLQRACYFMLLAVTLAGAIHGPRGSGRYVYAGLTGVTAAAGAGLAGRQTWLQHLPAERVPECGPGLEFMLEAYPLMDVLRTVLRGTGDCAAVDWTLLGLSIAEWSLLCFSVIMLACAGASLKWWRDGASRRVGGHSGE